MALKNKRTTSHFLIRQAGLLGLVAAVVGLVLWFSVGQVQAGQVTLAVGLVLVGISLLVELRGLFDVSSSHKGAVGLNSALQIVLAAILFVGVNYFSFFHYQRFDLTRDRVFTIDPDIRAKLAKLRGTTDIIVYQRHLSFGQTAENKQDSYDAAAERKIVEKVKDLVELFQDFGPRFRVQVLDSQDEDFEDRLAEIRDRSPELADAIKKAPENSIFFRSQDKVQRLAFHDIYQLDREASTRTNNLVLDFQGLEPFANKILDIEQKKPRVAVGVIHPVLGLSDDTLDFYSLAGVKKTLESQGFSTFDIILKKGLDEGLDEPSAYTYDENQFESLDEQRAALEETIQSLRTRLKSVTKRVEDLKTGSLAKLNKDYIYARLRGEQFLTLMTQEDFRELQKAGQIFGTSHVDEEDRKRELKRHETIATLLQVNLERLEPELETTRKDLKNLKVDELEEKRRIPDVKVKLNRTLADCDLLILPRVTMVDIPRKIIVPNQLHGLSEGQFAAVREFMKAGKPVLFCLGPTSDAPEFGRPGGPDLVEKALEDLGFKLPKQTILFTAETKAFAQRRGNVIIAGNTKVDVPPVQFEWKNDLNLAGKAGQLPSEHANPLRTSLKFTSRSLGNAKEAQLKLRYPRPVYYQKVKWAPVQIAALVSLTPNPLARLETPAIWIDQTSSRLVEDATFLVTDAASWNESQPLPTRDKTPQFDPSKPGDPNFGTILEERQGPFPIASAVEVELPASWLKDDSATSAASTNDEKTKVRLAVLGSGNVFTGTQLTPVQQKLLLDLSNWLLGRDDLLAKDRDTWQYPRVEFSDRAYLIWQWLVRLGLPLAFVYAGLNMWLVRRMR